MLAKIIDEERVQFSVYQHQEEKIINGLSTLGVTVTTSENEF